jgi:MSHA biogenesis protein MshK
MSKALGLAIIQLLAAGLALAAPIDPTQPPAALRGPGTEAVGGVPLQLQAIVRAGQSSRALIDGQSLRVGDEYAGLRVLAIHSQSVLIERQGQRELLRLVEPVLQPSR